MLNTQLIESEFINNILQSLCHHFNFSVSFLIPEYMHACTCRHTSLTIREVYGKNIKKKHSKKVTNILHIVDRVSHLKCESYQWLSCSKQFKASYYIYHIIQSSYNVLQGWRDPLAVPLSTLCLLFPSLTEFQQGWPLAADQICLVCCFVLFTREIAYI